MPKPKQQKMSLFKMQRVIGTVDTAEIMIYGDIGDYYYEGVSPSLFKQELDSLGDVRVLNIRINSDGGSVTDGYAIYNTLKQHKAKKIVYIDGIAASMGAFIAMAGDLILMSEAGLLMVHFPSGGAYGEADDLRTGADALDKMTEIAVKIHAKRTGNSEDDIRELMRTTSYFTAEEAMEYGFIDEIISYDDEESEVDMKAQMLYIRGQQMNINKFSSPKAFLQKIPEMMDLGYMKLKNKEVKQKRGVEKNMTLAEMRLQFPELCQQLMQEGANEERARLQAIDESVLPGTEELAQTMKYKEPKPAVEAMQSIMKAYKLNPKQEPKEVMKESKEPKEVKLGAEMLEKRQEEILESGMVEVKGLPGEQSKEEKAVMRAKRIAERMGKGGAK